MATDLSGSTENGERDSLLFDRVPGREIFAVVLWTLLADLLIFRASGYSARALFFALTPLLFFVGSVGFTHGPARKVTVALILLVSARLVWAGSGWTLFSGIVLVIGLSMSAAGSTPHVLEGFVFAGHVVFDGARRVIRYPMPTGVRRIIRAQGQALAWLLPISVAMLFAAIFVFANPNLVDSIWSEVTAMVEKIQLWVQGMSIWEIPFCIVALIIGAGLMQPALPMIRIGPMIDESISSHLESSPMYAAYRNTLVTLIALFAVYLTFEFTTLWKRDFPVGFYYGGYAHQGAAWLTIALALATVVLSVIFGGSIRNDSRAGRLRALAWIWSTQNVFLAAAVYNRLMIYVGYNGMTPLRMVGFFGITAVVIGFALVLYKIRKDKGFWWLIRSQLIALMLAVIVHSLVPVDFFIHHYNVSKIRSGYLHPAVMIAVKPITDEGIFPLFRLTDCEDPTIRDGVLAILAERQLRIEKMEMADWSGFQGSTRLLTERLREHQSAWLKFQDPLARSTAIKAFRRYAMDWY